MAVPVENNRTTFSLGAISSKVADGCRYLFGKVIDVARRIFNSIDRNHIRVAYFFVVTVIGQVIISSSVTNPHMTAFGIGVAQGILLELGIILTR